MARRKRLERMRALEENTVPVDCHDIVEDVKLKHGAELHRFTNRCGAEMSAIYVGDYEALWSSREDEESIIRIWNEHSRGIIEIIQECKKYEESLEKLL